jgi:hypothetical protein
VDLKKSKSSFQLSESDGIRIKGRLCVVNMRLTPNSKISEFFENPSLLGAKKTP